jgi:dTDP-4-amino-4,6-dideoxygalactose transaminase
MIPISKPFMDEREAAAAARVIHSGWVTQGPEGQAFESEFAAFTGAAHAVAVSSGTTALHLALHALGIGPGDEVITVSHSWIATANVIVHCGATPVFADIDPKTFNMDPASVAALMSEKTKAILAVHQIGMPCDLPALLAIAEAHDIPLVEDAACAIGSGILVEGAPDRQPIGRPHGVMACFSFHPRKVLSTGDGGMITTSDDSLAERLKLLRNHAVQVPESFSEVGFNYRLTDIQSAIGRVQLSRLPGFLERRRALAGEYASLLEALPGIAVPYEPVWAHSNWQSYAVRLDPAMDQRGVLASLKESGVGAKRGIMNAHQEPAYTSIDWRAKGLEHSEEARDHTILLPLYHQLTSQEIAHVVHSLTKAVHHG